MSWVSGSITERGEGDAPIRRKNGYHSKWAEGKTGDRMHNTEECADGTDDWKDGRESGQKKYGWAR
jgi:hypothetical protein